MEQTFRTMASLCAGESGIVRGISENAPLRRRLRELGLVDGATVHCLLQGAHRDIAVYQICGAQIAVRDCDAETVLLSLGVAE